MEPLGIPPGASGTSATGVSEDGSVIVGRVIYPPGEPTQSFRWIEGAGMSLLPPLLAGDKANASDISGDGLTAVGWSGSMAVRWAGGMPEPLGVLPGDRWSVALAVSDDGTVIVGTSYSMLAVDKKPFRWTQEHGLEPLGIIPGADQASAGAVSRDGRVVVGTALSSGGDALRLFRWTEDEGPVDLGEFRGVESLSVSDMSDDGRVIVGQVRGFAWDYGYIWTEENGFSELGCYLKEHGLVYPFELCWSDISDAYNVSFDGHLIVGQVWLRLAERGEAFVAAVHTCYADCDDNGSLDFFDFLCFQNRFATGSIYADCDDNLELDVFDFLCLQNYFAAGGC
jgi:hypothetical protein